MTLQPAKGRVLSIGVEFRDAKTKFERMVSDNRVKSLYVLYTTYSRFRHLRRADRWSPAAGRHRQQKLTGAKGLTTYDEMWALGHILYAEYSQGVDIGREAEIASLLKSNSYNPLL